MGLDFIELQRIQAEFVEFALVQFGLALLTTPLGDRPVGELAAVKALKVAVRHPVVAFQELQFETGSQSGMRAMLFNDNKAAEALNTVVRAAKNLNPIVGLAAETAVPIRRVPMNMIGRVRLSCPMRTRSISSVRLIRLFAQVQ